MTEMFTVVGEAEYDAATDTLTRRPTAAEGIEIIRRFLAEPGEEGCKVVIDGYHFRQQESTERFLRWYDRQDDRFKALNAEADCYMAELHTYYIDMLHVGLG